MVARPTSIAETLRALSRSLSRTSLRRWQSAIDGITTFVEDNPDKEAAFEQAAGPWHPAIEQLRHTLETLECGDLDRRAAADLRTIVASLDCLVDHLSDPSAQCLPAGELALKVVRCDVSMLVRQICDRFRNVAAHRAIAFDVDLPEDEVVEVDPTKVEMLLLNLLFNAFKHAPMRGAVRCAVFLDESNDTLVISVVNSGPGVPAAQREAIFSRSLRADRSTVFDGRWLGLSLAVSRDFARLHGGSLSLKGTPGRNCATFEAIFPAHAPNGMVSEPETAHGPGRFAIAEVVAETAQAELEAEERLSEQVARDHRPLVLIVEDNRATQGLLRQSLGRAYTVASAFNGAEGLQKTIELVPDIIITDVMMPEMNGDTMIRKIRQEPGLADIPILIVTASDDPAHVLRLIDAGFELLRKPFHHQELRARVRALIATKQARDILNVAVGRQENNIVALATEVATRQQELEVALKQISVERDAATRANRIKTNFLRIMSHELKTPIAAIELHLHMLARTLEAHPQRAAQEGATRMRRASRRLLHLIDIVIEWARIESGRSRLTVSEVDVGAIVESVVEELTPQMEEKGISLALTRLAAPPMLSDARLMRLVVYNLIGYAVQMTECGRIVVEVGGDAEALTVRVKDGGDAIQSGMREELFSPFLPEGDLTFRSGGGSGLGLHVVRDLSRALNGDVILLEPEVAEPAAVSPAATAAPSAASSAGPSAGPSGNVFELTVRPVCPAQRTTVEPHHV